MNGAADGPSSSTVGHFVSLTGCPENQAEFFLEATNGNFDQAVEMYYGKPYRSSGAQGICWASAVMHI